MFDSVDIYNISQGSEEWLKLRSSRLTASNTSIWINLSTFNYPSEYFKIQNMIISHLRHIHRGNDLEKHIRNWYSTHLKRPIYEIGFGVSKDFPMFGASPDGYFDEDEFIEIKTTTKPIESIPINVYLQVLVTGGIFGFKQCHLIYYSKEVIDVFIVNINHNIWRDVIAQRGKVFLENNAIKWPLS